MFVIPPVANVQNNADRSSIDLNGVDEEFSDTAETGRMFKSGEGLKTSWGGWVKSLSASDGGTGRYLISNFGGLDGTGKYPVSSNILLYQAVEPAGLEVGFLFNDVSTEKLKWDADKIIRGQWYHIIFTYDNEAACEYAAGTGNLRVYLDGVRLDSTTADTKTHSAAQSGDWPTDVGMGMSTAAGFVRALSHDLAAWDTVLTDAEVKALYNEGRPIDPRVNQGRYESAIDLKYWWNAMGTSDVVGADDSFGKPRKDQGSTAAYGFKDLLKSAANIAVADDRKIVSPWDGPTLVYEPDYKSLEFNGSNEYLRLSPSTPNLGPGNAFTISMWLKPDFVANTYMWHSGGATDPNNSVYVVAGTATSFNIALFTSAGAIGKFYVGPAGSLDDQQWQMITITWNGTTLLGYKNTSNVTFTKAIDNATTQTTDRKKFSIGANVAGANHGKILACHSCAVWNTVLSSPNITAIYNAGNGAEFNLMSRSGNYTKPANLQRWWRLGFDSNDIAQDFVQGDYNLMDDASNMSAADIVDDSPI